GFIRLIILLARDVLSLIAAFKPSKKLDPRPDHRPPAGKLEIMELTPPPTAVEAPGLDISENEIENLLGLHSKWRKQTVQRLEEINRSVSARGCGKIEALIHGTRIESISDAESDAAGTLNRTRLSEMIMLTGGGERGPLPPDPTPGPIRCIALAEDDTAKATLKIK
ncbi:MAG: hypothetical protein GY859_11710, partial [Desulfobacterales bacterium]|nr:hypothetical protein [Desulfobacterales bacterium]